MSDLSEIVYKTLRNEFGLWGDAREVTAESLLNEEFRNIGRVNDWRNYVGFSRIAPERARLRFVLEWRELHPVVRYIKFVKAFDEAQREDWD